MRALTFPLITVALLSLPAAHAATTPSKAEIQAAIDTAVEAKLATSRSSVPISFRVNNVISCKPSPEVKEEVVCIVGMAAGMREGYKPMALRQQDGVWVGVERKDAAFPPPTPAQAQAAIRKWAIEISATDPVAAQDKQVQDARSTMTVKSLSNCEVTAKTGYLNCDAVLGMAGDEEGRTPLEFAVEGDGWKFVPEK